MTHYDKNVSVVIQSLVRYGYAQKSIDWSNRCFKQLKHWFSKQKIPSFQESEAFHWVEGDEIGIRYKRSYRSAVQRLADVYETGNVLRSHLFFYSRILPSGFAGARDGYLSSIEKEFSVRQLRNISDACNRFLGFLCVNGISSLCEISYSTMLLYYQDMAQVNRTPGVPADIVEGFMLYLAEQGICSYGLGWYMFYWRSGKNPYSVKFTHGLACELSDDGAQHQYAADQMRREIPPFLEALQKYQYSSPVLGSSEAALRLLFIILDASGVHYSTALADSWIASEGRRLFKSSFGMARRGVELFDEYIKNGAITPYKWRKRSPSGVDLLPGWCRTAVARFMEQRIKEGRSPKTVTGHGHACTKLCQFLIEKGITGFDAMTPGIIKEFNLQDHHKTAKGKNSFNGMIRRFLMFLYREGFYGQPNLHFAIPGSSASRERIVDILTEDEKKQIQFHKEKSSLPLELRDAAIVELGLKMGLRGKDVINLKLSDIDWKNHTIRLIQSKTAVEVRLPMSNSVGNAIYRYLKEGRPSVMEVSHVFLKTRAPFGPVSSSVCRHAMERVLPGRDIPGSKFHATRRTFATDLLKRGTNTSMIADALGHSDIGTVHKYLSLDEERMRLCPLSLTEVGLMLDGRAENE